MQGCAPTAAHGEHYWSECSLIPSLERQDKHYTAYTSIEISLLDRVTDRACHWAKAYMHVDLWREGPPLVDAE